MKSAIFFKLDPAVFFLFVQKPAVGAIEQLFYGSPTAIPPEHPCQHNLPDEYIADIPAGIEKMIPVQMNLDYQGSRAEAG